MKTITFTCETITPMFLSGADGQTPELRPPSIKGALRFWWRAMNGGNYKSIKEMKDVEDEIFGSENKRSKIIIKVAFENELGEGRAKVSRYLQAQDPQLRDIQVLDYLSYGTFGGGNDRFFYEPNQFFYITLKYPEVYDNDIKRSFQLLSNFGGLGARSRNGYGSFKIHNLEELDLSQESLISDFTNLSSENLPTFSALSDKVKLFQLIDEDTQYTSWYEALQKLGNIYKGAREEFRNNDKKNRQFIGAPVTVEVKNKGQKQRYSSILERHSKSYFIKVIKREEEDYSGTILFLPYDYLYDIDNKNLKNQNRSDLLAKYNETTKKVNDYLERNMDIIL